MVDGRVDGEGGFGEIRGGESPADVEESDGVSEMEGEVEDFFGVLDGAGEGGFVS